jgi:hypothetical protein
VLIDGEDVALWIFHDRVPHRLGHRCFWIYEFPA